MSCDIDEKDEALLVVTSVLASIGGSLGVYFVNNVGDYLSDTFGQS